MADGREIRGNSGWCPSDCWSMTWLHDILKDDYRHSLVLLKVIVYFGPYQKAFWYFFSRLLR